VPQPKSHGAGLLSMKTPTDLVDRIVDTVAGAVGAKGIPAEGFPINDVSTLASPHCVIVAGRPDAVEGA